MIIDFHSHILPGLDHGCKDAETSLYQLKMAKSAGIDVIVATSHFYPYTDCVEDYLRRRLQAWERLQHIKSPELPRILLGTEIMVCEGMENMESLINLAIMDSRTMLLEMPRTQWNYRIIHTVIEINAQCSGKAILAHVDRYDEESVEELFAQGLKGQINVSSLCNIRQRNYLLSWIKSNRIVALGSDIHGKSKIHKKFRRVHSILGNKFHEIMDSSEHMLFTQYINRG